MHALTRLSHADEWPQTAWVATKLYLGVSHLPLNLHASVHHSNGVGLREEIGIHQILTGDAQFHPGTRTPWNTAWRVGRRHSATMYQGSTNEQEALALHKVKGHYEPLPLFQIKRTRWKIMSQFVGRVIGTKMQKTAKVEVCRMFLHPQVLKVL